MAAERATCPVATARDQTGSILRLVLALALATAAGSLRSPALANGAPPGGTSRTCDDAFADIYFMPNALDYLKGLPPGMKGLPRQHVHLPRAQLQLRLGLTAADYGWHYIYPALLCDHTAFAAQQVFYASTPDLARRVGIAYNGPGPYGDQLKLVQGRTPAPVDDSADREGTARRGYWIFDNKRSAGAAMYWFCVPPLSGPPELTGRCYVTADMMTMGYDTGTFTFLAQPFLFSTFYAKDFTPNDRLSRLVTPDVIESYFAFLHTLAAKVIVTDTPTPNK